MHSLPTKTDDSQLVLDVCCGGKSFWFDKNRENVIYVDKRTGVFPRVHSDYPRKPVIVAPTAQSDFTNLPFQDETFVHVVFDPPHLKKGPTGNIAKYYGVLSEGWEKDLILGFSECFRVLKIGGTLIFKWNEAEIPLKEILKLTTERPLYGHRSGKASRTHWVSFLKTQPSAPAWLR